MGNNNTPKETRNKTFRERIKAEFRNQTVLDWVKALGSYVVVVGIIGGIWTFYHEKEKEAAARLLNTITLLDKSKSQTVRAGAVTTLRVYLQRNYEKYQDRAVRVLACHLATEDDELVRETILNVLKEAKADAVAPLVLMNQVLTDGIILDGIEEAKSEYEISGEVKLKVSFQSNKTDGNRTEGILTIKQDGEVLAADILDIAKEKERNDFMTNLTNRDPNFCGKTTQQLRKQMLQIAVQQVSQSRDDMESEIAEQKHHTLRKNLLEDSKENKFCSSKLNDINKALVAVLGDKSTKEFKELDLSKVFLVSSELIDLNGAQLKGAILNYAILYNVDLTNTVLEKAELNDAVLDKVILKNAELGGARLAGANLAYDDLRKAKFVKADLCDAILHDADMTEAILDKANMYGADLTNAILEHASLRSANMTGARLELANLKVARLQNANLSGADLSRADLTGAYLTDANLAGATLQGAELEVKDIEGANLENADLRAKVLFGIDSKKFQSDFNKGTISEDLRQEFENNSFDLSQDTSISFDEKDSKWLINEKDYEQTYTIRKEDDQLKIYERTKLDSTELFSVDSKKFKKDLDDVTISKDLRQEFKNNGIDLSQYTTVSIEEKDFRWLINEKDYKQTYTVRKEERLNICTELFGIDSKLQSDLDKGTISEDFQKEFEDNEIYLSQDTSISIEEKDRIWLINEKDYVQTFTVRKEDGQLKIYERTELDPIELSSKDFQNKLDDGMISKNLQQKFENNGIYLSQNTTISFEEKDRTWLINDKDNKQTYIIRKEEWLNVCKETKFKFEDIKEAENWQKAIFDDDKWQKLSGQKK